MTASMLLARPETAGIDRPGERDNVGQVFHGQLPSPTGINHMPAVGLIKAVGYASSFPAERQVKATGSGSTRRSFG